MANFFFLSAVVSVNAASLEPKKTLVEADQSAEAHDWFSEVRSLSVCVCVVCVTIIMSLRRTLWCGLSSLARFSRQSWAETANARSVRPAVQSALRARFLVVCSQLERARMQTNPFLNAKCEKVCSLRPLARRSSPLSPLIASWSQADCSTIGNRLQISTFFVAIA